MKKILLGLFSCFTFFGNAQTYTFTTAGVTGRLGPTQVDVNTAYLTTNLNGQVTINTQGIQEWVVPITGNYSIQAVGASGGNSVWSGTVLGGLGSDMKGDFSLTAGSVVQILVGQTGETDAVGGGGGASYVAILNVPQIVAGGGGGASSDHLGISAVITESGTLGSMNIIAGGTLGNGGNACLTNENNGGAGGGFFTDGATPNTGIGLNNNGFGGLSFLNGGIGGLEGRLDNACSTDAYGGFGGGGSTTCNTVGGGGGGGYSGGAGGQHYGNCGGGAIRAGGGGGGSYNTGANVIKLAGINSGPGYVVITSLCNATTVTPVIASLTDFIGQCSSTPIAPTAITDCGNTIIGVPDVTLPVTDQGTTLVTWTFYAAPGVSITQTQNVILTDTIAPVADSLSLNDVSGTCLVDSVAVSIPSAIDNCEGIIYGTPDQSFPITSTTTIIWTYTDTSGNVSTQSQNIIISDSLVPIADNAQLVDIVACGSASPIAPTATDNCSGSIVGTSDVTLPITTNGMTVITWAFDDGNGNISTQTQNVTVTIVDNSVTEAGFVLTANATGATYQWLDCDGPMVIISGETGQSFSASSTGNYAVIVTENGCIDTSACTLIDFSGLTEQNKIDVSIYPIPTNGIVTIEFGFLKSETAELNVVDMRGRVINSVSISSDTENHVVEIDLSENESGVYFIVLEGDNEVLFSKRVVKK